MTPRCASLYFRPENKVFHDAAIHKSNTARVFRLRSLINKTIWSAEATNGRHRFSVVRALHTQKRCGASLPTALQKSVERLRLSGQGGYSTVPEGITVFFGITIMPSRTQ